jgi:Spy/CpxP family protein refolding chaperone
MTEQNGSGGPDSESPRGSPRRSRRGWIIAGSIVGVLALLAGTKAAVYAHGDGWHHGLGGRMSAEAFSDHIEHHVKSVLSDVDATAEQQAQVTSILQSAARDLHALKDQHASAHKELHEILAAETIDRARLETVRADQLRLADEASKRIVDCIADAAEVLTPEQRAALVARMERHHDDWQVH